MGTTEPTEPTEKWAALKRNGKVVLVFLGAALLVWGVTEAIAGRLMGDLPFMWVGIFLAIAAVGVLIGALRRSHDVAH